MLAARQHELGRVEGGRSCLRAGQVVVALAPLLAAAQRCAGGPTACAPAQMEPCFRASHATMHLQGACSRTEPLHAFTARTDHCLLINPCLLDSSIQSSEPGILCITRAHEVENTGRVSEAAKGWSLMAPTACGGLGALQPTHSWRALYPRQCTPAHQRRCETHPETSADMPAVCDGYAATVGYTANHLPHAAVMVCNGL